MSNSQEHHDTHTEEHGSLIKTPKQLITAVVLAFILPLIIILLLVNFVTSADKTAAGSASLGEEAINHRIAPVATLDLVDATGPKIFKTGEQVYKAVCSSCHIAGLAGAPKTGDKTAWAPRIATGQAMLTSNAIKGKGAMPAKGGNPALDDYEIARAVVFMANGSGGDFKEPEAPAAPADATKK